MSHHACKESESQVGALIKVQTTLQFQGLSPHGIFQPVINQPTSLNFISNRGSNQGRDFTFPSSLNIFSLGKDR